MLTLILLANLAIAPDDPPRPKPRPAAMVLDLKGKVEVRPTEGALKVAEAGELLYPGERLVVPVDGSATVSILGAGVRETIKPGTEVTVGLKGCSPPESIEIRKEQPKAVASTMKNLRPTPGDGRKAGVGFRSAPDPAQVRAITPILGSTVAQDRPTLAWPPADKAESYRVKLLSGAGRELWKAETRESRLTFPEEKEPLQPGYVYRWEVTDPDNRKVAAGEFSTSTSSERAQLAELNALAETGDRADRYSAALGYRRLAAFAEAIATYERLVEESPDVPAYQKALAELYDHAGRPGNKGSGSARPIENSLKRRIEAMIVPMGEKVVVEVAFHDLKSGETCLIRADEPIHPASTMKVPVMIEVFRQAIEGKFGLDDPLKIKDTFPSLVDGSPFQLDPKDDSERTLYGKVGQSATIRELVRLMITESSNLATNLLVEKVSPTATTATMKELGADGLKVLRGVEDSKAFTKGLNNVGTARGLMTVLKHLAEGSVVSKAASEEMLGILRAQKFNEGIPAGLPKGVPVAHKTGSITAGYHDAALVEIPGRKPFVLVVMTRGIVDESAAHKLVAEIARAAYEHATHQ